MSPAVGHGAALFMGMLVGFMFPLAGTVIISAALGSLLLRAAKDLAKTRPEKKNLQSRSSQTHRRTRRSVAERPDNHDWPLSVHGYDSPELFREDALMHIRQTDREIAEQERNILAILNQIKKLEE